MATATTSRAPRGTKVLAQAFFAAADNIPEAQRGAVVKAALALIRDDLKAAREKAAAAKTKAKGKSATATPAKTPAKKMGRPVGSKNKVETPVAAKATKVAAKPVKAKRAAPKRVAQKPAIQSTPEVIAPEVTAQAAAE